MKDRIETYIMENREEFDIYEPGEKLWSRIETELSPKKVIKIHWQKALLRVAAIALIFMVSWAVQRHFFTSTEKSLATQIPEVSEVETLYQEEFESKLSEVKKIVVSYPEIEQGMNHDIAELDSVYVSLKEDLKDGMANEEIIGAMIQNYKLKLQILEDLLFKIQKSGHLKGKHNNNGKKHAKI